MSLTLGPFRFLSSCGDLEDLAAGKERPEALQNVEARLPQPNSLRRAAEDSKTAVVAATELLRAEGHAVSERLGLYVGQQQIALDYCARFIESSYREGPRMASPMLFSESVANNVATHLSLTLGLKGLAQTFIGTRAAGIQAVMAAAEDVRSGHVDVGLVVVLGVASSLTRDAYLSVYRPFQRRNRRDVKFLRGSVAMLVRRDAPGQPRLVFTGVRCAGRGPRAQITSVGSLWTEADVRMADGTRVVGSTLLLARERSQAILRRVGETIPGPSGLGESYALDPFVRLLLDGVQHPGGEGRAVLCLGEEGTAAMLALDGPGRVLKL
ncbi:MAG: hypothetical protein JO332_16315 [Planctomycetaceae bacterium]|nr:hypothetical protein [Planctomycetaceae bacterium]